MSDNPTLEREVQAALLARLRSVSSTEIAEEVVDDAFVGGPVDMLSTLVDSVAVLEFVAMLDEDFGGWILDQCEVEGADVVLGSLAGRLIARVSSDHLIDWCAAAVSSENVG